MSSNPSISRSQKRLPFTRAVAKQKEMRKQLKESKYDGLSPTSRKIRKDQEDVAIGRAFQELLEIRFANGGMLRHNDIQGIIDKYKKKGLGTVERWHIEYRLRQAKFGKYVKHVAAIPKKLFHGAELTTDISPLTCDGSNVEGDGSNVEDDGKKGDGLSNPSKETGGETRRGGRAKGTTVAAKKEKKFKFQKALTDAATRCCAEKSLAISENRKVLPGVYKNIVSETELLANIPSGSINYETIRSRISANNPTGECYQKISPLYLIEPVLVDFCCELSKIGEALIKEEIIELADDMTRNTKHEKALREFCEKRKIKKDWEAGIVGERWYRNFMKRYSHRLRRAKCKIMDRNRQSYCTYENFANMYNAVYEKMVEAKVAIKLDHEVMFAKDGRITQDPSEMYGRPSRYLLTHPERCVFVDETGCNTNCKNDGLTGGQQHVTGVDQVEGGRLSVTTDIHFPVLAFTSGTGEPIMCAVILKSDKELKDLPVSSTMGIDITKNVVTGETDVQTYDLNVANGVTIGGPVCRFQGKEISTFVCCTPNASITSELLAEMLKQIDAHDVFRRANLDGGMPFLLLDGHGSRTRLPFVDYISNENHLWKVCIGVPYGTHLWQVHDSSELNGTFKIKLSKAKKEYLKSKPRGGRTTFVTSDIIPLINKSWETTLGNKEFAKKAIAERGWGPLTYVLLDHPNFKESKWLFHPIDNNANLVDLETINQTGAVFEKRLDMLVEERSKSLARKQKYDQLLSEDGKKLSDAEKVALMTSVTSGQMCAASLFCVSQKEVRDRLLEMEKEKENKISEKLDRQISKEKKQKIKFRSAAKKFFSKQKQTLRCADMRVLLKQIWKKGDGPLKTKLDDLTKQLESRKERLDEYNIYDEEVAEVQNNANFVPTAFAFENSVGDILIAPDNFVDTSNGTFAAFTTSNCNGSSSTSSSTIPQNVGVSSTHATYNDVQTVPL